VEGRDFALVRGRHLNVAPGRLRELLTGRPIVSPVD
jgi:hypothetical protein